jgi:hypothetical protein
LTAISGIGEALETPYMVRKLKSANIVSQVLRAKEDTKFIIEKNAAPVSYKTAKQSYKNDT